MKKKKILFAYYTMMLGGSTTSLLSMLENFDYDKYDVDLILYRNQGPYIDYIPEKVNLLPQACVTNNRVKQLAKCVFNGSLPKAYFQGIKYCHKRKPNSQSMAYTQLSFCRKIKTHYDVAIGFLELWSDVFVNERIDADKKISWVHVDFEKAHYIPDIDRKMFAKSDIIVHVSEECKANFEKSFPELSNKCVCVENVLTKQFIQKRANKTQIDLPKVDRDYLNLLSVCRLAIDHKGLDRGIKVLKRLKDEGQKVRWYIVGDGPDKDSLMQLIHLYGLEEQVFLLGVMECPYPLFELFDAFFLPSRFEGKPMAVTEALMLGLPPIVSNYASANEQIQNGIDGLIADNSEDGLYDYLYKVCEQPRILNNLKTNILQNNYDNVKEIEKVYALLEE